MTIALAIKANDGLVIAADTQESYGFIKAPQAKVRVYEGYGPYGSIESVCAITR
jgi:20S proteasome alpha/beta subunit